MQRQRGELVPIGEVVADLDGPVQAIREATPQAQRAFTRFDQVNQLVEANEADADLGFIARLMALCTRTGSAGRLFIWREIRVRTSISWTTMRRASSNDQFAPSRGISPIAITSFSGSLASTVA